MRSVAARSSRPLKRVVVPDWLHRSLKLGDPDIASAVFPAYAENRAVLFVCIGGWEALSDVRCIDRVDHVDVFVLSFFFDPFSVKNNGSRAFTCVTTYRVHISQHVIYYSAAMGTGAGSTSRARYSLLSRLILMPTS